MKNSEIYPHPKEFLGALAASTPTPGGGAASAVTGATGGALLQMVAGIVLEKKKDREELVTRCERLTEVTAELGELGQRDARAYRGVMDAFAAEQGQSGYEEKKHQALCRAATVPLEMMEAVVELMDHAVYLQGTAGKYLLPDVKTALHILKGSLAGASEMVQCNLELLPPDLASPLREEWEKWTARGRELADRFSAV